MKQQFTRQGFTLVELLVTIAIIAILAGILLPTVIGAFKKASEAQARTEVKSIETAIKQYFAEYGKSPLNAGFNNDKLYGKTTGYGNDDNKELMNVLRAINGQGNGNHANNPRRIVFLEVNENSLKDGNFIDPWEWQYLIAVDTDFDNTVELPSGGTLGINSIQSRNVAVWSFGVKQQIGSAYTNDYIVSWR